MRWPDWLSLHAPASDETASNTNANKGIVDNYLEPYTPLLDKMRELNQQVYHLADFFDQRQPQ